MLPDRPFYQVCTVLHLMVHVFLLKASCPDNYEEGPNGHCYRFRILDEGTRWMRGRQTCDNVDDSDYAIINDQEELDYLVRRSAEVDPDVTWWIGT